MTDIADAAVAVRSATGGLRGRQYAIGDALRNLEMNAKRLKSGLPPLTGDALRAYHRGDIELAEQLAAGINDDASSKSPSASSKSLGDDGINVTAVSKSPPDGINVTASDGINVTRGRPRMEMTPAERKARRAEQVRQAKVRRQHKDRG